MNRKVYAVIGSPVHHSKSPDIYNYLFKKHGLNGTYISIELTKDNLPEFIDTYAPAMNLAGINVTMPLKDAVAKTATNLDKTSSLLGAVNTLDLTTGKGYTTDGKGMVLSLIYQGFNIKDKNIVVMGAGGAAKSVVYELSQHSPASLTVLNRTKEKAQDLADMAGNVQADSLFEINKYINNCDLLINCTSMGMSGKPQMDLSLADCLNSNTFVYDIIYEPRETELLKKAKAKGCKISNGIDMLICQALYAFEIYTGILPNKEDRDELIEMLS